MILDFRTRVEKAWCPETAYGGSPLDMHSDPATGQCAVTALLFHECFGGKIKKAIVIGPLGRPRIQHFWNVFKGVDVDLTWRQFPAGSKVTHPIEVDPKALTKSVRKRYDLLKERFEHEG